MNALQPSIAAKPDEHGIAPFEHQPSELGLFTQLAQNARQALDKKSTTATIKEQPEKRKKATPMGVRTKIVQAISAKNLAAIEGFVSDGYDFNFYVQRGGHVLSPLNYASQSGWEQGIHLLLDAGAREHLARSNWEALSAEQKKKNPQSDITIDQSVRFPKVFARLFENEPQLRPALINQAMTQEWGAEMVIETGAAAFLKGTTAFNTIEEILFKQKMPEARRAQLFESLWTQVPEFLAQRPARRWGSVLRGDALETLEVLARKSSDQTYTAAMILGDIYNLGLAESRSSARPFYKHRNARSYSLANIKEEHELPLWLAAVVLGASRCLRAFSGLDTFRERALAFKGKEEWLAFSSNVPTLREALRQGLKPEDCVNEEGETPLMLAALCLARTRSMELAGFCPQWLSMKDTSGRTPIGVLSRGGKGSAFGAALEKIAMADAMGVSRTGKKKRKADPSPSTAMETSIVVSKSLPVRARRL